MTRTIAVVHNAVTDPDRPDEADVLVQVDAVSRALTGLGYRPVSVPCDLNLAALKTPWRISGLWGCSTWWNHLKTGVA